MLLATSGGVGFLPFAPGTWGSIVGVALAFGLGAQKPVLWCAALAAIGAAAFYAVRPAQRHFGVKDPSQFVIDETAGQLVALSFLPVSWRVLLAGFVLFRLFDILKPFGIRRIDRWSHPAGVVLDDLAAGAAANLVLHAFVLWRPAFWAS